MRSAKHGDEREHTEGEGRIVKKALVIAWKSFWQCDLLDCDGVFHIKWQMPHHTQHLMWDESGFAGGKSFSACKGGAGQAGPSWQHWFCDCHGSHHVHSRKRHF